MGDYLLEYALTFGLLFLGLLLVCIPRPRKSRFLTPEQEADLKKRKKKQKASSAKKKAAEKAKKLKVKARAKKKKIVKN